MEENIESNVVNSFINDKSEDLINLMRECNISDGIIMLTLFGIGTHTEYYAVLYNRLIKQKDILNDEIVKKEASDIFHEIDRNEDE